MKPEFYLVKAEACGEDRIACADHLRKIAEMMTISDAPGGWTTSDMSGSATADHVTEPTMSETQSSCCDKPGDRMWHAADNTWWCRVMDGWLSADPPPGWIDPCVTDRGLVCHHVSLEESPSGNVWRCRRCGKIIEMESGERTIE